MSAETIIGSYRIGERIGRGGMGEVFRGQHTKLPREVAIKSISPRARAQDLRSLRHRFEREAFIQSQLDHPGIVKIYDYIVAEQTYYIVMEYVEGLSLAQLLAAEAKPLAVERALYLFDQILTAVAYAHSFTYKDGEGNSHRGIIHRDFKPANLLVTRQDRIKITDFGIVKLVGADTTDTFGTGYGSPRYVSPEQAEGSPVDQRSDIYSLGVILYEMLTGSPPFGNANDKLSRTEILRAHVERLPRRPSEINADVTPEVESIILRALEKDPAKRFQSAAEFLRAVRLARARDASDVIEEAQAAVAAEIFRPIGTHELDEGGGDHTVRQSYATQPIHGRSCSACGAEVEGIETSCRVCGARLDSSPSTANLTRQDATRRASARGKWAVVALIMFGVITSALIYLNLARAARRRAVDEQTQNANATGMQSSTQQSSSPPSPSLVELKPAHVVVDSSFEGYNERPLTDGVTDVRRISALHYNEGNWASAETPGEHWIELRFDEPVSIAAVYVFWGFDKNRYLPARHVELQTSDGDDKWRTISTVEPGDNYDRTSFEFAPVKTTRLRVLQPAQQGPQNRAFIMWAREVQVFGAKKQN
ncbi:MAG: eukaryotic-like serine/threonine-protein kinase [Acidobacteriota bacterium]|nr:eukaryotic-like serine/threonine-protein kinase [Acidobacteriota bacterium]